MPCQEETEQDLREWVQGQDALLDIAPGQGCRVTRIPSPDVVLEWVSEGAAVFGAGDLADAAVVVDGGVEDIPPACLDG
jgi:hypothetical protein